MDVLTTFLTLSKMLVNLLFMFSRMFVTFDLIASKPLLKNDFTLLIVLVTLVFTSLPKLTIF